MKHKICKITNGNFGWTLEVDGEQIAFTGRSAARYFKQHYTELGYIVEIVSKDEPIK